MLSTSACSLTGFDADSPMGAEMDAMLTSCVDMQEKGSLPNAPKGRKDGVVYEANDKGLSYKGAVNYPIRARCDIYGLRSEDDELSYPFIKESATSQWTLVP